MTKNSVSEKSEKQKIRDSLHSTALKAPHLPGVYLWRDEKGKIIYVGKAKNLKNRLSSYFALNCAIKTRILVSRARSIDYITTSNEYEALLLENTLIKKHRPQYNIDLKDDKSYPVLRITGEKFPRIFKTRRIVQDGSQYFGPFPNVAALDTFLEALYRIFKIRHCKTLRKKTSPCIYFHIGRCAAPCCEKISEQDYKAFIGEICAILENSDGKSAKKIEAQMKEAAKNLQFEKAARLRDGMQALRILSLQNAVQDFDGEARDYIAFWADGEMVSFVVLKMRSGRLVAKDCYRAVSMSDDDCLIEEFLLNYYTKGEEIPPKVFVPTNSEVALAKKFFAENLSAFPEILAAGENSAGEERHAAALAMARQNAHEDIVRRRRERGDIPALKELAALFSLPSLPARIEGFDIAHLGGKFPVASLVSFFNGNPDKKNYRYFRLRTTDGIIDDFASMREAATRRYSRLKAEGAPLPDLILIDGGIGQVNAVQGVLDSLELKISILGLAEKNEDIYLPRNSTPISLPRRSDALRLLQRVRDETHRFATSRNQNLRTKEKTALDFEAISGVGKKRAYALFEKFGDIKGLCAADVETVAETLKCGEHIAKKILDDAKDKR